MNYEEWLEWREEYFKEGVNLLNEEEDCKIVGKAAIENTDKEVFFRNCLLLSFLFFFIKQTYSNIL